MAFIGLKVPASAARALSSIEVPAGAPIPEEEMHVTLLYLGKGIPVVNALGAAMGCHTVAVRWKPFMVHAAALMSFPENPDDGLPVIARVVSSELGKFREEVRVAMDKMSIPYSNKYPEYKPHVTLAYAAGGTPPVTAVKIGPVSWEVRELTVWGGQEMTDVVQATLQLMG